MVIKYIKLFLLSHLCEIFIFLDSIFQHFKINILANDISLCGYCKTPYSCLLCIDKYKNLSLDKFKKSDNFFNNLFKFSFNLIDEYTKIFKLISMDVLVSLRRYLFYSKTMSVINNFKTKFLHNLEDTIKFNNIFISHYTQFRNKYFSLVDLEHTKIFINLDNYNYNEEQIDIINEHKLFIDRYFCYIYLKIEISQYKLPIKHKSLY